MKRIDAIIRKDKLSLVTDAVIKAGAGGLTISDTKGKGSGERPTVRGGRGTTSYVAEYNQGHTITSVVDDSKVDSVVQAILEVAHTGTKADGKVFVSSVQDAYNISTKTKEEI